MFAIESNSASAHQEGPQVEAGVEPKLIKSHMTVIKGVLTS